MYRNRVVQRSLLAVVVGAFIQGCSCGDSPKIAFEPPEEVRGAPPAASGLDVDLCPGASVTLGTPAQAGLQYAWTPAEGLSDAKAARPVATPGQTTVYTLKVTDPSTNKSSTDAVQVRVLPLPTVDAMESRAMGAGGSTVLSGAGSGTGEVRYAWSASPECEGCISDRSAAQPTVSPAEDTTFTLTVTDAAGCSASATAQVHVTPALTARALAANAGGAGVCAGGTTLIGDEATGGAPPYQYAWTSSCADCLSDPSAARPSVTVTEDSVFTQTVTDANGNTASASVTVSAAVPPPGLSGEDLFVSPGSSVELAAEAAEGAGYAWSCERDDCAFGPSDTTTSRVVVQPTHSTRYALDGARGEYCSVNSAVTVWVALQTDTLPNGTEASFPQNAKLVVQFDQPMDAASLSEATVQVLDVDENVLPSSHELSADGHFLVVSVAASGAYAAGNDYTLVLTGGPQGVRSADPVRANILPGDLLVDYTLGAADTQDPSITFRSPAPDATDAPANSFLLVVFSEPMLPTTLNAANVTLTGEVSGPVAGSLAYDLQGSFLTLRPTGLLNFGERYTVSLTGLTDLAGRALPDTSWSFTVGATTDEVAPSVVSVNPADGATGVRATSAVTLVFNEVVDPTSLGGIEVRDAEGARLAGRLVYTPANATVVFTPAQLLGSHVEYRVHVDGVRDLVANAMAAPFESRFTTRRILFFDDFEKGTDKWALQAPAANGPSWGLETRTYRSAFHSLTDSVKRKYANHSDTSATVAQAIDLVVPGSDPAQTYSEVLVQFWLRARLERLNDFALLEYSFDGGATWVEGGRYGKQNAGTFRELTLSNATGATGLLVRFRLTSDSKRNFDGIAVDDVLVQGP